MKQRRDAFQRKCAAIRRMTIAMTRLDLAACIDDKVKAGRWVAAWQVVADIRQFKLDRPGKRRVPRIWHFQLPPCV
jgi:hypothetical protein